jgi:hypothetical protein
MVTDSRLCRLIAVVLPVSPVQCPPREPRAYTPDEYHMTAVNVASEELADVIRRLRWPEGMF